MTARYEKGCEVVVTPIEGKPSLRDADLELYSGKIGIVTDYHWIQPTGRDIFYIYTVRIKDENTEVVLHEDELQPHLK